MVYGNFEVLEKENTSGKFYRLIMKNKKIFQETVFDNVVCSYLHWKCFLACALSLWCIIYGIRIFLIKGMRVIFIMCHYLTTEIRHVCRINYQSLFDLYLWVVLGHITTVVQNRSRQKGKIQSNKQQILQTRVITYMEPESSHHCVNVNRPPHDDVTKMETCFALLVLCEGYLRWIPLTKASNAELWCFLLCAPDQLTEQTVKKQWFETPWGSLCRHCNAFGWP